MKTILFFGIYCVLCQYVVCTNSTTKTAVITEANMNAYMDYVLIQFGPYINAMGWIPMDLPDITESFEAVSFVNEREVFQCFL